MAINIDGYEAYDCIETAIGNLSIFGMTIGNQLDLNKKLNKPILECKPDEFVRILSIYICYPVTNLREGKYKPKSPILTTDDTELLTVGDLEKISKIYVENNEYLFRKYITRKKKDDKGQIVHYGKYKEIEFPKNEDESYLDYLHRLFHESEKKLIQRMEQSLGSIWGVANFSNNLIKSLKSSFLMGDSLRKAIEGMKSFKQVVPQPIEPITTKIDFTSIDQIKESNRRKQFDKLAERLDQLIDSSAQSSEFMIEANKIQTMIAAEIKSSSDITSRFSKKNIWLSCIVILITFLSLIVTAHTIYRDNVDGEFQRTNIQNNMNAISRKLSDIDSNLVVGNNRLADAMGQFQVELKKANENENNYQTLLEIQNSNNDDLRFKINEQREKIERLEAKIQRIENGNDIKK